MNHDTMMRRLVPKQRAVLTQHYTHTHTPSGTVPPPLPRPCGPVKDCTRGEDLPDVCFTIMGSNFCMTHNDYVVYGEMFGEKECLTAMVRPVGYN